MGPSPSPDLHILLQKADAAARRLQRKLRLPHADLDDLRQDLLVDLIRRLPAFDARRGTIGGFVRLILRNHSARIAMRVARERTAWGGPLLSLDVALGHAGTLGDRLGERSGLAAWYEQRSATEAAVERRLDLSRALGALCAKDRALCAGIIQSSVGELANREFGSRTALYRRIGELRFVFTAYGLGRAWDDFRSA